MSVTDTPDKEPLGNCSNCETWKSQAQANAQTVKMQSELIRGLKMAIKEIVDTLVTARRYPS